MRLFRPFLDTVRAPLLCNENPFCRGAKRRDDNAAPNCIHFGDYIFSLLASFLCRELHSEYEEIDVVAGKKLGKEGSRHKVKVVMRCENGWFSFTEGEKESASSNTTTRKPVIRINDEKEGRFYEYTKHRIYN